VATGLGDALIAGAAAIERRPCELAVMDFAFMGGSMGSTVGEKFARACERAAARQVPLVCVTASGGARMQEGILALMQMARAGIAVQLVREAGLPYFALLTDPTTGGVSASFAMLGDITIAEPGAIIGFAGARVIEQTIRESLPAGFQKAEYLLDHGMVDLIVHRSELRDTLVRLNTLLRRPRPEPAVPAEGLETGQAEAADQGEPAPAQSEPQPADDSVAR
jgi:acetyl-CoA carboxylase carboxyl transferase subunit beta